MSPLIDEHYFGGKEVFYNDLLDKGLLQRTCQRCRSSPVKLFFCEKQNFPRTYCPSCSMEVASCRNGTIFQLHDIKRVPAFMFLMKCVVLRVSVEAAITLSGLDPDTARRYIDVIRSVMTHTADVLYKDWEGELGGTGHVVEIDEAFLVKSKYNVGRRLSKDNVIVLGMTERKGGPTRVEDIRLLEYLMDKEGSRSDEDVVQQPQAIQDALVITRQTEPIDDRVDENTAQIELGDDDDDEDDVPVPEPDPAQQAPETLQPAPEGQQQARRRFQMVPAFENAERQLFGPKERHFAKRTILFVVPNRRAETLIPLIRKYVKPGTVVFTDHFLAYWDLQNGYEHFTVVHKKRFVTYLFFRNQVVLKVTTNHIERVWVEMRKDLRGVKKEDVERRLREVPYRLYRLWSAKLEDNEEAMIADMRSYVTDQLLALRGSAFRTSRPMEE